MAINVNCTTSLTTLCADTSLNRGHTPGALAGVAVGAMHAGTALLGYAAFSTFGLLWCIDDAVASGLSERAVHHINKDWLSKCASGCRQQGLHRAGA